MSASSTKYPSNLYLSPNQQELLLAALSSNKPGTYPTQALTDTPGTDRSNTNSQSPHNHHQSNMANGQFFESPIEHTPITGTFHGLPLDDSPFLDYDDADASFDFDFSGAQMIGDLPDDGSGANSNAGSSGMNDNNGNSIDEGENRDKRKSIDGKSDDEEGGGKRREGDDKAAKKPGRKPLTSEPTSKRKAQNRAAQRAFRERKEKHLKDLETKVEDLEKASESANHENGLLKAQVERLTIELREYRKRLSFIGSGNSGISRSPPVGSSLSTNLRTGNSSSNDFQFEFPKFGDLPGAHIFNNGSFAKVQTKKPANSTSTSSYNVPGVVSRKSTSSSSPRTQAPGYPSMSNPTLNKGNSTAKPTNGYNGVRQTTGIDGLTDLFSPSILESVSRNNSLDYLSHPGSANNSLNQANLAQNANSNGYPTQLNGSSSSNTDSPSASSESQQATSSIGTSPEPSLNSPSTSKLGDFGLSTINEGPSTLPHHGGEKSFCQELSKACGNCTDPVPLAMSLSNGRDHPLGPLKTPTSEVSGINWLAAQNEGQFDPVLFGGYRDPQDAVITQDFGSFFNDAFPLPDLGSPFNNYNPDTLSPPAPRRDPLKEAEDIQNGADEEMVPAEDVSKMLTCNKIWDRLQSMDSFQNGELDMDSLCTELRTKAKCSESGAVVGEKDVDDILKRVKAMKQAALNDGQLSTNL